MRSSPHLDFAGEVRAATKFPVFHAARIQDVATARHAIATGKLDMVGMTRAHIADPHIVAKLVRGYSAGGVLMDEARMREHGLDVATVLEAARAELRREPGVAEVFTRAQLMAADTASPLLQAMRHSFHPARSAPLQLVLEPGWIASYQDGGSSHGSPYEADTHVPLFFWGPSWVGQGREDGRVEIADLAPTLAAIIGVAPPAGAQGRDLNLRPQRK